MAGQSVKVELLGLDDLNAALRSHPQQIMQATGEAHRQLAERQAAQIRANAPRPPGRSGEATGALAGRIRVRQPPIARTPLLWDVVVGEEGVTPYLGHLEFGTRTRPAYPFVRMSVAAAQSAYESTMLAAARRRLG